MTQVHKVKKTAAPSFLYLSPRYSPPGVHDGDGDYQDVWKFTTNTQRWCQHHISGPREVFGKPADYGTKGVAKAGNLPPAEHAGQ